MGRYSRHVGVEICALVLGQWSWTGPIGRRFCFRLLCRLAQTQTLPRKGIGELLKQSCAGLTGEQQKELCALVHDFMDIFTNIGQHITSIDTGNVPPIRMQSWHLLFAKQTAAKEKLRETYTVGVIEPSDSPWSFPVVLVKKKDNLWRFCVNYWRLTDVTGKDSY